MKAILLTTLVIAVAFAGCQGPAAGGDCPGKSYAVIETSFGDLVLELFRNAAPQTVAQFTALAEADEYDGTLFDDVRNKGGNKLMLGGDTLENGTVLNRTFDPVPAERLLSHDQSGRVSWGANGRFFVMFAPILSYDDDHNVFAQVVSGLDVLAGIQYGLAVGTGAPLHPIVIEDVRIGCQELLERTRVNFITPSLWQATGSEESIGLWVANEKSERQEVRPYMTFGDGTPLPLEWHARIDPPTLDLAAKGTQGDGPNGRADFGIAVASMQIPDDVEPGDYTLLLHAGDAVQPAVLRVLEGPEAAAPGWSIHIEYRGRLARDQSQPESAGGLRMTVGFSEVMPGIDIGVHGLAQGEGMVLHLPGALAVGPDSAEGVLPPDWQGRPVDLYVRAVTVTG